MGLIPIFSTATAAPRDNGVGFNHVFFYDFGAIRKNGIKAYCRSLVSGVPLPIRLLLLPLEIEVYAHLCADYRLLANMLAGRMVMLAFFGSWLYSAG